jgi:16S rRNA (guanine(966)-N(2))-methyltransferase RsmD
VRIVGGEHRGRKLKAPPGRATRPTSERVREALFDILSASVPGSRFLDLYSGTGAVGLEALSRGAAEAVLVESRARALSVLRANVLELGVRGARVLPLPAERALGVLRAEGFTADVAFCDPPYSDAAWPRLLSRFGELLPLRTNGHLVLEHESRTAPPVPEGFEMVKAYRYGDTGLTVMRKVRK